MSIKKLKEILDEIDHPVYVEVVDNYWMEDGFDVSWNTDDDEDALENGAGNSNTYSIESIGDQSEYDGYRVVNGNTGCGETVTYFFNLEKEVKF